ncbi:MAG TPA: MBL fold metallo-hydrolase [Tepidisphaeraceae bacterium]|nr:MBL fold metallo-hydrolase [Tepidisphaeraceae bacterium]
MVLRLADRLGRSRGRLRFFDQLNPPPRARCKPDLSNWNYHDLAAVWIGHATVLLRIGGMTILTDPVWSSRVGIGLGPLSAGPRRFIAPALKLSELPPIDLILISHAHFDHLDRPTLHRLSKNIPIITAAGTRDLIDDLGFANVSELKWGESKQIESVRITAQRVEHWGARTFHDTHRGFNGYLIESPTHRVLYGGDSAYHEHFKHLEKVDLAILGIAAYNPWIQGHATPEQTWQMTHHAKAERLLPMHHSTFRLSHEPMAEPMQRLLSIAGADRDRIVAHQVGDMWTAV